MRSTIGFVPRASPLLLMSMPVSKVYRWLESGSVAVVAGMSDLNILISSHASPICYGWAWFLPFG